MVTFVLVLVTASTAYISIVCGNASNLINPREIAYPPGCFTKTIVSDPLKHGRHNAQSSAQARRRLVRATSKDSLAHGRSGWCILWNAPCNSGWTPSQGVAALSARTEQSPVHGRDGEREEGICAGIRSVCLGRFSTVSKGSRRL